MSETHRTLFNKRRKDAALAHANGSVFSCRLLIAGAFVLLAVFFAFKRPTPEPLTRKQTVESPQDRGLTEPDPSLIPTPTTRPSS